MSTLYHHEIESYKIQLEQIRSQIDDIDYKENNLTQFAFAISNRSNFFVVGLCGLIEARLFEMAQEHESIFKLSDIRGQGISRLKIYLERVNAIDFSELKNWDSFQSVYKIRNWIVHSYGGMVIEKDTTKLQEQFSKLNFSKYLINKRRIRLGPDALEQILSVVDGLLDEIDAYET